MQFHRAELIVDPYPHYARWREEHPVWQDQNTGAWILTRHDDVRAVLKDAATFSSEAMGGGEVKLPLLTDDPPRHTHLRGLVNRAFTSRMLKSLEGFVAEVASELLDQVDPGAATDIVEALTIPLPVAVIARMMGIPGERADDFKRWSDALTGTLAGTSRAERQKDIFEMAAYFQSLIPERRKNPGDDLVSAVVNAEIDGERLTDQDIVGFNILLLIAGNETTTNLLGNFLNVLADRPAAWAALKARPDLIEQGVEEALRFDGPVQFLMRKVTRPVRFHGQDIESGEIVQVVMGSANRDPRAYDDPDEFKLDRNKNHHHTLGYGIHFCLGAPLARLEANVAMRAMLERFDGLRRADGVDERVPSHLLRGFNHLAVALEAG